MSRNLDDADPVETGLAPVAQFEGVRLFAGGGANAGLWFALPPGSLHFLIGAPGSGKTAVIDLLSAARPPLRGRVELLGLDLARVAPRDLPALRRRIGVMFQDQRLVAGLSVLDNVALAARVAGRAAPEYRDEAAQLLAWMGLARTTYAPPGALSEPERRRLALARALINRPELLLLDEPTAGLGDKARLAFLRLVAEINEAGTTVVIATADEALARTSGAPLIELPSPVPAEGGA